MQIKVKELISFVIPTFNEASHIVDSLEKLIKFISKYNHEIIIVDDGKDNTFELINDFKKKSLNEIKIIKGNRKGKGAGVKLGLLEAKGEIVFYLDSDLTIPLENIDIFIEEIRNSNYDIVIGKRILSLKDKSFARIIFSLILLIIGRLFVFHSNYFYDTQCGFKAFKRDSVKKLISKQQVDGGMFDLELMYIAKLHSMKISQIVVTPLPEIRKSVLRLGVCMWKDPLDLFFIKVNRIIGRYN